MLKFIYIMKIIISFVFLIFLSTNSYSADCSKPSMPSKKDWQNWIEEVKILASESGISNKTIESELNKVKPASKIIMRDRCQVESTITLNEYLFYRVDKARIFAGKKMINDYQKELNEISKHFEIQPRFIIAILGLESSYGKNQGKVNTIEAVSTLAFDRRRSDFYKKQLIGALRIIDNKLVKSENLKGSWGGAIGMTQMIPTTYLESGYDWNKDGFIDIWNNYEDVFASIANYLTTLDKNPWSLDTTWGREVTPPDNLKNFYDSLQQDNPKGCGAVKSRSKAKTLNEWSNLGFRNIDGSVLPDRQNLKARLIAPDGIDNRLFLVYQNYKNILYYNCSSYYAVAIGLLSDEFNK